MEAPTFILYEHAAGYALFRVKEFEEIGNILPQVESAITDKSRFASVVKLVAFVPFLNPTHALDNCHAVSEGVIHEYLQPFLEAHVPKEKKTKTKLGVGEPKLAASISEQFPYIQCIASGIVPEIMRGIRVHFPSLVTDLSSQNQSKAQLGLGHSYSRAKVKFNIHRVDNMIIQCIAILDQSDKDINTFSMRIREWYSYHFPELYKVVGDQYSFCRAAKLIGDRKSINEEKLQELKEILMDDSKIDEIVEAARSSMGMDINEIDLANIERFASRVISLAEYRKQLQAYLRDRMGACAPSLSTLIGEQVGARLISHAGSLLNLAKFPASTIQILGAEKALFRALKTRGPTPKYGLLFHSSFIGRAQGKNKGRISRYLANKCALASRIDCFGEIPVPTFGEFLKDQVEQRLKFYETGDIPDKNVDVMHKAAEAAAPIQAKVAKKRKRKETKEKSEMEEQQKAQLEILQQQQDAAAGAGTGAAGEPPKKRKKKKQGVAEAAAVAEVEEPEEAEEKTVGKKKKKKGK